MTEYYTLHLINGKKLLVHMSRIVRVAGNRVQTVRGWYDVVKVESGNGVTI